MHPPVYLNQLYVTYNTSYNVNTMEIVDSTAYSALLFAVPRTLPDPKPKEPCKSRPLAFLHAVTQVHIPRHEFGPFTFDFS